MKISGEATIQAATARYEAWLGEQLTLVQEDLERKHQLMRSGPFLFLRGSYYRWAQLWPQVRKPVRTAKEVLAVGDLHVENFGTWRDAEGRLVWGINDFDEARRLPYTNDLLRLATSVSLAISAGHLAVEPKEAAASILSGYREGLEAGGRPIILDVHWRPLRQIAMARMDHSEQFWEKLDLSPDVPADAVPPSAAKALFRFLPAGGPPLRFAHRIAGIGSLGRQRFVVISEWCGGRIAREAKAATRSAYSLSRDRAGEARDLYREILGKAVRCQDPCLAVRRRWIVRRLAPDCLRIELADLPKQHDTHRLLRAMGWETANIHLGSTSAASLLVDLAPRSDTWLHEAVEEMLAAVHADWKAWTETSLSPSRKKAVPKVRKAAKTAKKPSISRLRPPPG